MAHLKPFGDAWPDLWRRVDWARARRSVDFPMCPDWSFIPMDVEPAALQRVTREKSLELRKLVLKRLPPIPNNGKTAEGLAP